MPLFLLALAVWIVSRSKPEDEELVKRETLELPKFENEPVLEKGVSEEDSIVEMELEIEKENILSSVPLSDILERIEADMGPRD